MWNEIAVPKRHSVQSSVTDEETMDFILLRGEYDWRRVLRGCRLGCTVLHHLVDLVSFELALSGSSAVA